MTNQMMHSEEGLLESGSITPKPSDNASEDAIANVEIYEWASDTMILAQVKPQEENSSGDIKEKFLLMHATPKSLELLSQHPFEILGMWISSAGFPMERVQEITSWSVSEDNGIRRLVLRCESGRMFGADDEGAQYLTPTSVAWAKS